MTKSNVLSTLVNECTQKCNETVNKQNGSIEFKKKVETPIVWGNVIFFFVAHVIAIYGLYRALVIRSIGYVFFHYVYVLISGFGITAGAHRLWAHRSYKARFPLRVLLALFQCVSAQNSIYTWARDHRVHHKFTDTDADPHNATRGFFFSHIGWLLTKKHPDVMAKGKLISMKDVEEDPVVAWQTKYYYPLMLSLSLIMPMSITMYFWKIDAFTAFSGVIARWVIFLHLTWLINSGGHKWGNKPYDKDMKPVENIVIALLVLGEGWHNYHHVFPFDYKTSELGNYSFNNTNAVIDFFARIGWAYDLKTVSEEILRRRIQRTGDGTHKKYLQNPEENNEHHCNIWGWGDEDLAPEDRKDVTVIGRKLS